MCNTTVQNNYKYDTFRGWVTTNIFKCKIYILYKVNCINCRRSCIKLHKTHVIFFRKHQHNLRQALKDTWSFKPTWPKFLCQEWKVNISQGMLMFYFQADELHTLRLWVLQQWHCSYVAIFHNVHDMDWLFKLNTKFY